MLKTGADRERCLLPLVPNAPCKREFGMKKTHAIAVICCVLLATAIFYSATYWSNTSTNPNYPASSAPFSPPLSSLVSFLGSFFGGEYTDTTDTDDARLSLNRTGNLGYLEITVFNVSEDFYEGFEKVNKTSLFTGEVYETHELVQKKYCKAYIKVFNNFSRIPGIYTEEDNEEFDVWIEDDFENRYEQDEAEVNNARISGREKVFGNSMVVSPRTSIEGYLIFSETKGTPEKLIVQIKSGAQAEFILR